MSKWTTKIPERDGWYWINYDVKYGQVIIWRNVTCPCEVYHLKNEVVITTARNNVFTKSTRKYFGFASAKFGKKIPVPKLR